MSPEVDTRNFIEYQSKLLALEAVADRSGEGNHVISIRPPSCLDRLKARSWFSCVAAAASVQ